MKYFGQAFTALPISYVTFIENGMQFLVIFRLDLASDDMNFGNEGVLRVEILKAIYASEVDDVTTAVQYSTYLKDRSFSRDQYPRRESSRDDQSTVPA